MSRLTRWLGSLMVAIPLLVAIGGVLAWGTIYETRFGTAAAQRFVYHAWWFQLLLGFLAVNLAVSAWTRYPWKRVHTPFLCAHLGIILLLVGGILGGQFGIEGQVIIPEGQTEHTLLLPDKQLVVHDPQHDLHAVIPTAFETQRWRHTPDVTVPILLGTRAVSLTVDRYYPDAVVQERVEEGGAAENPAIHLLVEHAAQEDPIWLWARDQDRFGARWGDAHVFFLEVPDAAHLAMLTGRQAARHWPPNAIMVVKAPADQLAAVLTGPAGEQRSLTTLVVGTRYTHPWLGYQFAVEAYYPRARLLQDVTNRSDQVRAEMLHVVIRNGAQTAEGWVGLGNTVELPVGPSPLIVEFRQAQRPLPFSLTLTDVRRKDYPGTQMPQAYESDVTLTDPERGLAITRTIRMNMPLRHRGYTFFQASYIPGEPETTVLAVRKDPGTPFVYAGFLIVIAGVVLLFCRRPTEVRSC